LGAYTFIHTQFEEYQAGDLVQGFLFLDVFSQKGIINGPITLELSCKAFLGSLARYSDTKLHSKKEKIKLFNQKTILLNPKEEPLGIGQHKISF
jgi:hypothetical protein